MKFKLLTLCIITLLLGCSKQAGEGGKSTVKGKILVEDWNNAFTIKNGEYPGLDVDVFIIYGDNVSYNDKTRANYNGEFEFKYLRKGKYTIYVITKDKTLQSANRKKSIIINFELTGKKETKTLDQITVYE